MKVIVRRTRQGLELKPPVQWAKRKGIQLDNSGDVPHKERVLLSGREEERFMALLAEPVRNDIEVGWCLALEVPEARAYFI